MAGLESELAIFLLGEANVGSGRGAAVGLELEMATHFRKLPSATGVTKGWDGASPTVK